MTESELAAIRERIEAFETTLARQWSVSDEDMQRLQDMEALYAEVVRLKRAIAGEPPSVEEIMDMLPVVAEAAARRKLTPEGEAARQRAEEALERLRKSMEGGGRRRVCPDDGTEIVGGGRAIPRCPKCGRTFLPQPVPL